MIKKCCTDFYVTLGIENDIVTASTIVAAADGGSFFSHHNNNKDELQVRFDSMTTSDLKL